MEFKYINQLPKPLLSDFLKNRVIPVVGAGFSKNADIPAGLTMPDWRELGKAVASYIPEYEYDNNPIDTLSYYEELYSRPKLVELIMAELHHGLIQPGNTYKAFCEIFRGTICTTNFDTLLEDAMVQSRFPVSVIATEDRLSVGGSSECKIIKLHGDYNHPERMVITEKDYDLFTERNPVLSTYVANLFISNTMMLIGYSLDDYDFRGIWQVIINRLGKMSQPAYCITVGMSKERISRYQRRGIRTINIQADSKDYKQILFDLFSELKNYRIQANDNKAFSKNEKVNEQMLIPAEDNRLCCFSCAGSQVARLSSMLYPFLDSFGITPVRVDDMIMPGENWFDVFETIVRKSKAAIIDISIPSEATSRELETLLKTMRRTLLICDSTTEIPCSLNGQRVLKYSLSDTDSSINQSFSQALAQWCVEAFALNITADRPTTDDTYFRDAINLFNKCSFSSCIISAFSELEFLISRRHENALGRPNAVTNYIIDLCKHLPGSEAENTRTAKELISIRNQIAHQGYSANYSEAKKYLELIISLNKIDIQATGEYLPGQ